MSTRIRRGTDGPTGSLRTLQRRSCPPEVRELAALAEVDALLTESRIYLAVRGDDGIAIDVVCAQGARRAALAVDGPGWGVRAPGDAILRLASALLADALDRPVEEPLAQAFADDVLARVPDEGFALSALEVRGWVIFHRAVQVPDRWS